MKFIADFHLHSRYSRATSPRMDLQNLNEWAEIKGIKVLGTADFTHPFWFKNLKEKLEPAENGLFKVKNHASRNLDSRSARIKNHASRNLDSRSARIKNHASRNLDSRSARIKRTDGGTRFILSSEISCIYSKGGKVRKIHIVVLAPSFDIVEKINKRLTGIGNLSADGRPILGLDAKELLKIILDISEDCLVIPAHVMTPWFSIFGSKSGFDSIKECFEEYSKYIFALETGLSADPPMIWRIPAGEKITLISNSDAHSPANIGREANVFDTEIDYYSILKAIKSRDPQKFLYTIEFFPQEGKYHYDGHRTCSLRLSPKETKKYNGICPNCGKPLTVGVLNRIEQLSVKPEGFVPERAIPFKSLVPLREIIAEVSGVGVATKNVEKKYRDLIEKFGNELNILLNISRQDLEEATLPEIGEGIIRAREGKVFIEPGYDGVYGKVRIFSKGEKKLLSKQGVLF